MLSELNSSVINAESDVGGLVQEHLVDDTLSIRSELIDLFKRLTLILDYSGLSMLSHMLSSSKPVHSLELSCRLGKS